MNVDARAERRLLEEQRDVLPRERLVARCARSRARISARAASSSTLGELRRAVRSEHRQEVLRDETAMRSAIATPLDAMAHVRYSALMRTYSALKSQVHIVASCAPPVPRSTVERDRRVLQDGGRLVRALVVRDAGHEDRDVADANRRAIEIERRARSSGGRDQAAPVRDRRREWPS